MAEIDNPKTVTELTVDIVSDDPCEQVKYTLLGDVGYITVKFASGRVFSVHVREVKSDA